MANIPLIVGAGIVAASLFLLLKPKAEEAEDENGYGIETCKILNPGGRYEFVYIGPRIRVFDLLGECYDVVYYLEIFNEDTLDWVPPANPMLDYVETNSRIAVFVIARCEMCGVWE